MTRKLLIAAFAAALALWACRPDVRNQSDSGVPDGDGDSDTDTDVDSDADSDADSDSNCAYGAEWVYLVDSDYVLIRFQPDELELTRIGHLDCPGAGMGSPFSMSVDRDGTAWVLYNGGRIYHVSTEDASCTATTFTPNQAGFELFGMGFVSEAEGSNEETLFIAGGSQMSIGTGSSTLGFIDDGLVVNRIGNIQGWPELTGTGSGELWGFFPDTTPPSVRQLDKTNGSTLVGYNLDSMGSIQAQAWAFAAWGGRFYIFLQRTTDASTHVWRFDPSDASLVDVIPDTGYRIVGAGVSTCAPYDLI